MRRIYLIVLLTLSIALFLPLLFAPPLHGDNPGHLFKVHKLMSDGWKPWIKDWYAGFPFMRFYPPMSYLIAAFLGHILKSHIRGYAATLMVTSFLGALALHTYLKKTGRDPYIAPVVFLLFPWHIWVVYSEGNFPRANAINLSPLFLLSVYFIAEYKERYLLLSALGISLFILTHHSIVIPLVILSLALHWKDVISRKAGNIFKVGSLVIFLTAFWYVPFIYDIEWANFWDISQRTWLFKYYSVSPESILNPIVLAPFTLLLLLLILSKKREFKKPFLLGLIVFLSLGYYSPVPWIYGVFPLSVIPPYRWLDLTNLLVPLMVADAMTPLRKDRRIIIVSILICILALGSMKFVVIGGGFGKDTLELATYLRLQHGNDWRYYVFPANAIYSYLPAMSTKATLNGWYHDGNPADREMERLWYLLANDKDASFYLKAYNVRFLVNIKQPGYRKIHKIGRYTIYEGNTSFAQPVPAIMVGNFYDLPLDYAYLPKLPKNLDVPVPVIYSGNPNNVDEKILREFLNRGGTIIWVPEEGGTLFGISATIKPINSSRLYSDVYNVSMFAPFIYEGHHWFGAVFENVTPLVKMGRYALIGVKNIGRGRIYVLGGNFLYHVAYTGSKYELEILKELMGNFQMETGSVFHSDGEFRLSIVSKGKFLVRISEAYFPYWEIKANDTPLQVIRDYRTGLMLVTIQGPAMLSGKFNDPFIGLRLYSLIGWILVVIYTLFEFRWKFRSY